VSELFESYVRNLRKFLVVVLVGLCVCCLETSVGAASVIENKVWIATVTQGQGPLLASTGKAVIALSTEEKAYMILPIDQGISPSLGFYSITQKNNSFSVCLQTGFPIRNACYNIQLTSDEGGVFTFDDGVASSQSGSLELVANCNSDFSAELDDSLFLMVPNDVFRYFPSVTRILTSESCFRTLLVEDLNLSTSFFDAGELEVVKTGPTSASISLYGLSGPISADLDFLCSRFGYYSVDFLNNSQNSHDGIFLEIGQLDAIPEFNELKSRIHSTSCPSVGTVPNNVPDVDVNIADSRFPTEGGVSQPFVVPGFNPIPVIESSEHDEVSESLLRFELNSNGTLLLVLDTIPGDVVELSSTTNFQNWQSLGQYLSTDKSIKVSVSISGKGNSVRFFRLSKFEGLDGND